MPERIKVANPVVDMDGDEMTRVIWQVGNGASTLASLDSAATQQCYRTRRPLWLSTERTFWPSRASSREGVEGV
eukprot:1189803-Prorocentrum_minimum.AAC.2